MAGSGDTKRPRPGAKKPVAGKKVGAKKPVANGEKKAGKKTGTGTKKLVAPGGTSGKKTVSSAKIRTLTPRDSTRSPNKKPGTPRKPAVNAAGKNLRKPAAKRFTRAQVRRNQGIALLVGLGAVFALGWAGFFAVGKASEAIKDVFAQEAQRAAEIREASAVRTFPTPQDCAGADLNFSLSAPGLMYSGGTLETQVKVTNQSQTPCLIKGGAASLGILVVSGSQNIWNSTTCPAPSQTGVSQGVPSAYRGPDKEAKNAETSGQGQGQGQGQAKGQDKALADASSKPATSDAAAAAGQAGTSRDLPDSSGSSGKQTGQNPAPTASEASATPAPKAGDATATSPTSAAAPEPSPTPTTIAGVPVEVGEKTQLLLAAGSSWESKIVWAGTAQGVDCANPGPGARPGTYRVSPFYLGQVAGKESVFAVRAAPPAPPATPNPAPASTPAS